MSQSPNATPTAQQAPPAPDDVPFSAISGVRTHDATGASSWAVCVSARDRTGIAHGPDFRGTMAAAIADLAARRLGLVP
jgi:hypothetical protein